jgi:hypothetical protein
MKFNPWINNGSFITVFKIMIRAESIVAVMSTITAHEWEILYGLILSIANLSFV